MVEVAKEYGLSDRGLAKLCERNGIPVPPRGYWSKKHAGQKVFRSPLLVLDPKEPDTVLLIKQAVKKQETDPQQTNESILPDAIREAIEREFLPENLIHVAKTLSNPHTTVARWIREVEQRKEDYRRSGSSWFKPEKTTELDKRRWRIISTLLKELEARGFKTVADRTYNQFILVKYERDEIGFTVTERVRQYRRELTPEEKKEHWNANSKWKQISEPTGMLMLRISKEFRGSSWSAKDFQETDEQPLENQLNAVVAGFIEKLWSIKKQRMECEEEDRQRWKRREEAEHREKLLKEEQQRKAALETKTADWKKARDIREYVAAVISACSDKQLTIDEDTVDNWKQWALAHAEELDPIAAGNPLVDLMSPVDENEDKFESKEDIYEL